MRDYNIIATTYRGAESRAASELLSLLEEAGSQEAQVGLTDIPGILVAKTEMDPLKFVEYLYETVREEPWRIRLILRVIPVEKVVETRIDAISAAAWKLAEKIGEDDTFKIVVEKRYTSLGREDIIREVAKGIDRKVDLESPDWIVLIEILGGSTGVSVIRRPYVFSSVKAKRGDASLQM